MADHRDIEVVTPYARSLGIALDRWDGDTPVLRVEFSDAVQGRPGALHGGAISGLLETAGYGALRTELARGEREAQMKPINITVQFLRSGKTRPSFARARIVKLGRRTANISVEAWQDDEARPIASAVMNILMVDANPPA
ncbi:PaaI family thioesterase [Qipengyuania sp. SM2507]